MEKQKIIVVGAAGRMGKIICETILASDDFELAGAVERAEARARIENLNCPVAGQLDSLLREGASGVTIDFTSPDVGVKNARTCAVFDTPLVIGTTGFSEEQKGELRELALNIPLLWSANMSVGVNAILKILPELAKLLGPAYDMEIVETHHRHKRDAPSGTALMLAESLAASRNWNLRECARFGREGAAGERPEKEIGVLAVRGGEVAGAHDCHFFGPGEEITVSHRAESRQNFANGALRAARWLAKRPAGRLYGMIDVLEDDSLREE